jgi:hypothetical protein
MPKNSHGFCDFTPSESFELHRTARLYGLIDGILYYTGDRTPGMACLTRFNARSLTDILFEFLYAMYQNIELLDPHATTI